MEYCRFPLYITPEKEDAWKMLYARRMERQGWSFSDSHPTLKTFWAVAGRSLDRARRRYLRACSRASDPDLDAWFVGAMAPGPSGDETFLVGPADMPQSLPPHFNFYLGRQDPRLTVQMHPNAPVSSASRSPGAPLDTSSNKGQRTPMDHDDVSGDISLAEYSSPSWNESHVRLDMSIADMERAVEHPTLGWSSFERLSGASPGEHPTREIFDTTSSRGLDRTIRYGRL